MADYKVGFDSDNRVQIPLKILHRNKTKREEIKFKYDTGADRSTISLEDLLVLGYDVPDVRSVMKRNGGGSAAVGSEAEWFIIDLNINHIMGQIIPKGLKFPFVCITKRTVPVLKPECIGCELTGDIYEGFRSSLLGNDILSCFDVVADREKNEVTFTRVKDIDKRNKQYPNAMVSEIVTSTHEAQPLAKLSPNAQIILEAIHETGVTREAVEMYAIQYGISKDDTGAALIELESNKIITRHGFTLAYKLNSNNANS